MYEPLGFYFQKHLFRTISSRVHFDNPYFVSSRSHFIQPKFCTVSSRYWEFLSRTPLVRRGVAILWKTSRQFGHLPCPNVQMFIHCCKGVKDRRKRKTGRIICLTRDVSVKFVTQTPPVATSRSERIYRSFPVSYSDWEQVLSYIYTQSCLRAKGGISVCCNVPCRFSNQKCHVAYQYYLLLYRRES